MIDVVFFDLGNTLVAEDRTWVPGAPEILAVLRDKSIRLGIISNTRDRDRNGLADILPPDFCWDLFESELVILSFEVGKIKPAPMIFQEAIKRSGVEPSRSLFCTEELSHAMAAQRTGMLGARLVPHPGSDIKKLVAKLIEAGLIN